MRSPFVHRATIATLLSALTLGACGIKGDLKTPPPLWGDKTKAEQAEQQKPDGEK